MKQQGGIWVALLLFCLLPLIPALADDEATEPPAREEYLGRRIAHTMHWTAANWLTRTEREREEATSVMLNTRGPAVSFDAKRGRPSVWALWLIEVVL